MPLKTTSQHLFNTATKCPSWLGRLLLGILILNSFILGGTREPFDSISLKLYGIPKYYQNSLDNFWETDKSFGLEASTPFYWGTVSLGISQHDFIAISDKQPDFETKLYYFKWHLPIYSRKQGGIQAGISIGNLNMTFLESLTVEAQALSESEMAIGFHFTGKLQLTKSLSLFSEILQNTIFTRKKIQFGQVIAGLSWQFSSPRWLRLFLSGD